MASVLCMRAIVSGPRAFGNTYTYLCLASPLITTQIEKGVCAKAINLKVVKWPVCSADSSKMIVNGAQRSCRQYPGRSSQLVGIFLLYQGIMYDMRQPL